MSSLGFRLACHCIVIDHKEGRAHQPFAGLERSVESKMVPIHFNEAVQLAHMLEKLLTSIFLGQ